jgi:hypothetical protein
MKKNMLSKALAIGVIILFVSIGFKPAFAIENKLSNDNTEKNEDCNCLEGNRHHPIKIEFLLTKLKVVTNILLLRFGHLPEIKEICQNILDIIGSNRQQDYTLLCNILENYSNRLESRYLNMENVQNKMKERSPYIGGFFSALMEMYQGIIYYYNELLNVVGYHLCNWPWPVW